MKLRIAKEGRATAHRLPIACAAALAVTLTIAQAQPAEARRVRPPQVPAEIEADAESKPFLVGHAVGTQNYICLPSGEEFAWSLFTPEATLFDDRGHQLATHFFSLNPVETHAVRPAWQHSQDTSRVWATLAASSSDPAFVAPGSLPWLLLDASFALPGPRGGETLGATTQIQRVNTAGGLTPTAGCAEPEDVGNKAFVPYTADYYFYRSTGRGGDTRR